MRSYNLVVGERSGSADFFGGRAVADEVRSSRPHPRQESSGRDLRLTPAAQLLHTQKTTLLRRRSKFIATENSHGFETVTLGPRNHQDRCVLIRLREKVDLQHVRATCRLSSKGQWFTSSVDSKQRNPKFYARTSNLKNGGDSIELLNDSTERNTFLKLRIIIHMWDAGRIFWGG